MEFDEKPAIFLVVHTKETRVSKEQGFDTAPGISFSQADVAIVEYAAAGFIHNSFIINRIFLQQRAL